MKRKIMVAVCLILIFAFSVSLESSENIRVFSIKALDKAAKLHLKEELNDSVIMTPFQSYFNRATKKFTLTLNFSSSQKALGYSLYIFSSKDFSAKFVHHDHWYFLWANQPTSRQEVIYDFGRRQRFSRLKYCKLLGVALNKEQQDLGDLIIEVDWNSSFAFVFYVYSFKDENALSEEEEKEP